MADTKNELSGPIMSRKTPMAFMAMIKFQLKSKTSYFQKHLAGT